MRVPRLFVAGLVTAGAVFVVAPSTAGADERVCRGTIGAAVVDDLRVPASSTCTLNRTQVRGNIVVERGARLTATTVRVDGNIQAEGAAAVIVGALSHVDGNVQVKQGGSVRVTQTRVDGDIQYDENRAEVRADDNVVGGNIQVMKNRGGAFISNNRVDGDLQCKENSPAPRGSGNQVRGDMEDQCRRLVK